MSRVVVVAVLAAIAVLAAVLFLLRDDADAPQRGVPVGPDRAELRG